MTSGSGAKVAEQVIHIFDKMRLTKADNNPRDRPRIVVLHHHGGVIDVEPEKIFRQKDLEAVDDVFMFLMNMLNVKECRYILYDCHFETHETPKTELTLIYWAPDEASIHDKILYSSSKQYLKNAMNGIKHDLEFQSLADIADRKCFTEKFGKQIVTLEGKKLK